MASHCTSWHWNTPVAGAPGFWSCSGYSPGDAGSGTPGKPPAGTTWQDASSDGGASDESSDDGWVDDGSPDYTGGGAGPSYSRSPGSPAENDGGGSALEMAKPWLIGAAVIALGIALFYEAV